MKIYVRYRETHEIYTPDPIRGTRPERHVETGERLRHLDPSALEPDRAVADIRRTWSVA
jgi:hypothetical protein